MSGGQLIKVVVYDLNAVSRFFRSVALAMATQHKTTSEWKTYDDSTVLNVTYTVLFWKEPPGYVEVKTASPRDIQELTDKYHLEFLTIWLRRLNESPQAAHEYVERMVKLREAAKDAVQEVFRNASAVNDMVINQTNEAISRLAKIKLASQVGVAVIGAVVGVGFVAAAAGVGGSAAAMGSAGLTIFGVEAGAGAGAFALTGAAHSVTHSVIKTWESAPSAQIAGVSTEIGKSAASEAGGQLADKTLQKALAGTAKSQQVIKSAQGEITKYSQRLAQEGLKKSAKRKAQNIVARQTANKVAQQEAIEGFGKTAGRATAAGMAIPVVFAAWDIWDAIGDYNATMKTVE